MPAEPPTTTSTATAQLQALGQQIRTHRKALGINAISAAEAAGLSRVTLHRIERGEPSVTMGAYLNVITALGLACGIITPPSAAGADAQAGRPGWIPARIPLADYPQLKQLAWQVHGTDTLTPPEAWGIYERNWRHIDQGALAPHEQQLIDALRTALAGPTHDV